MTWQGEIRRAAVGDVDEVAGLAAALAMSFEFSAARFRALGYAESATYFRKVLIDPPVGETAGERPP
jgi:hypothetical protein